MRFPRLKPMSSFLMGNLFSSAFKLLGSGSPLNRHITLVKRTKIPSISQPFPLAE
jgi:hypothetical protein